MFKRIILIVVVIVFGLFFAAMEIKSNSSFFRWLELGIQTFK